MIALVALACTYSVDLDETGVLAGEHARLEIEDAAFDFGDVEVNAWTSATTTVRNTGGWRMALQVDTTDEAFCAHWRVTHTGCGYSSESSTADSWSSQARTCADGFTHTDDIIVLDPGCEIEAIAVFTPDQVGTYLAGMRVESRILSTVDGAWLGRDPRNFVQYVRLDGHGVSSTPFVALSWDRPVADFPWRWPDGGASTASMNVVNVGDGALTIGTVDTSCPDVTVTSAPVAGTSLAVGETSAPVELAYTPTSEAALDCTAQLFTDEGAIASAVLRSEVPVRSASPTVSVLSPSPGERVSSAEALPIVIALSDESQPPSSLSVHVGAGVGLVSITEFPADDSGRATIRVPAGGLLAGADTLDISVTDLQGNETHVTVPIRVDTEPDIDEDGDGWGLENGDCRDSASTIYPFALELSDGEDNDCDGTDDDNTDTYDDDGDGMTEADGDCDDANTDTYTGATERSDLEDNDCDDVVDNDTNRGDDDGDGFSEWDDDCDDGEADASPYATEVCDGIDNDCDGLRDEADVSGGCPRDDDELIVAYIDVAPDACLSGETVTATLVALPADATVQWGTEYDTPELQPESGAETTFICPGVGGDGAYLDMELYALATDSAGDQGWVSTNVEVHVDADDVSRAFSYGEPIAPTTACNPNGAGAFVGVLGVVGLATLARRRR